MRKNSPRKWVHALLDLLPLLILPIFALAVRSDNNFQPIEVQVPDYEVVDFNQYFQVNNVNIVNENYTITNNSHNIIINGTLNSFVYPFLNNNDSYVYGDIYYFRFLGNASATTYNFYYTGIENSPSNDIQELLVEMTTNIESVSLRFVNGSTYNNENLVLESFNLTQMFGVGNEPTIEQFNTYFPNDYYEYTTSKKVLLNVGTTTYNDTDVGSQMVYTLYNATDKYFNMNSVFNLNSVWSWIQLNIFNGNTPLVAYVIWQVIIYEFIVDILFIFYSFFMFLIDFCEYLLEKPFNKINRGK